MDLFITILSLLLLLIVTKLGVNLRYKKLTHDQCHAVVRAQQLTSLIGRIQQYRCEAITAKSHPERMVEIARQINRQRENLHDDMVFFNNESWLGFIDHWSRLRDRPHLQSLAPKHLLNQFDAMISNLIQLVEELADGERLNKEFLLEFPNINLLWREFPLIIENAHKLILLNEHRGLADENSSKREVILLKLILQLTRTSLHHVRYNGSPNPKKEVLLSLAMNCSQQLQRDLESGILSQNDVPRAFRQSLSGHLKAFVQAMHRLQVWELDALKNQVSAGQGGYASA